MFTKIFRKMIKVLVALLVCAVFSLMPLKINDSTLTVFYSLAGVLFSVGMSLVISFNSSRIRSEVKRNTIRERMHGIRNNLIVVILLATAVYVVYSLFDDKSSLSVLWYDSDSFKFESNWSFPVLMFLIYCSVVFVSNFLDIQDLYEDIDDKIQREEQKRIDKLK